MKMNLSLPKATRPKPVRPPGVAPAASSPPDFSRRGVALVITLIMLSVTLVMAVAFLAISRRDRAAVSTTADATTARLASDAALAYAENQIMANLLANTNQYGYSLLVSTNYINPLGFANNESINPTNVNYINALSTHNPNDLAQNIANLQILPRAPVLMSSNEPLGRFYLDLNRNGAFEANGWQPQVDAQGNYYTVNNLIVSNFMTGDPEWIGILSRPDAPHSPQNQFIGRYAFLAQPIGNSLDFNFIFNQVHNRSLAYNADGYFRNQSVGSWELNLAAFLADLNTNIWDSTYGAYNHGLYSYNQLQNYPSTYNPNQGQAFLDAYGILNYRYGGGFNVVGNNYIPGNYTSLAEAQQLFNLNNNQDYRIWQTDDIDEYSDGPLMNTPANISETNSVQVDDTSLPWAGADNTNRLFDLSELYDQSKLGTFATDLGQTGYGVSSYNRYTYYRMLDQIGLGSQADSLPDPVTGQVKMNLNYDNLDATNYSAGSSYYPSPASVTNFIPWTDINFFTNAADRILRYYTKQWYQANPSNFLATYYGYHYIGRLDVNGAGLTNFPYFGMTNEMPIFGITNIPVIYHGNVVYSPSVNRLLQLAANLYDASATNFYPSVFKPVFFRPTPLANNNVTIAGYVSLSHYNVNLAGGRYGASQVLNQDLIFRDIEDYTHLLADTTIEIIPRFGQTGNNLIYGPNVYGVPWIIGAKKGLPNFNEFSFDDIVQFTRKLRVIKRTPGGFPTDTNQWLSVNLTNKFGIEYWNSYTSNYVSQNMAILVADVISEELKLTNGVSLMPVTSRAYSTAVAPSGGVWYGNNWVYAQQPSQGIIPSDSRAFLVPLMATNSFLTNYAYSPLVQGLVNYDLPEAWVDISSSPDQFVLYSTNYMRSAMIDNGHIVDYVQFDGPKSATNLTAIVMTNTPNATANIESDVTNMWSTYLRSSGVQQGIFNQLQYSSSASSWAANNIQNQKQVEAFAEFTLPGFSGPYSSWRGDPTVMAALTNTVMQAPFTPTVTVRNYTTWQANDPLVHYVVGDLALTSSSLSGLSPGVSVVKDVYGNTTGTNDLPNIGRLNDRYAPWGYTGGSSLGSATGTRNAWNPALQDPQVWASDYWDFPTNKYPAVGWIGRVHRGTPWQTIYLKSQDVLAENGGAIAWQLWTENGISDATNSAPVKDRWLFDLFTTAPDDNATRGLLSVNQTHLAAWSALFSGMVVLENTNRVVRPGTIPTYGWTNISPAGTDLSHSALYAMVQGPYGINATRANTNLFPLATFQHVGDILSVPALTDHSPFFNTNLINGAGPFLTNGITDAAYEWLPQQAMSLLHLDTTPRYVIYCYGQTLKPAQRAEVTSGNNFGLVTNYQIVAESAARAIVSIRPKIYMNNNGVSTTNYSAVVESYTALPPN